MNELKTVVQFPNQTCWYNNAH